MRYLLFLLMYDFILILVMCTWPELHTCILCMKTKPIKENETRVNTLLNQFTYKLQKKTNKQTNKQTKNRHNKTNLLDSPNLEKLIQEKLSKTSDLILSLFLFSFFFLFFFLIFPASMEIMAPIRL